MDCNIQRRGIPLASKCVCCATPKTKTLEHLLVQSDIAKNLWSHFAHKLHKKMNFRSFHHLSLVAARWASASSTRNTILAILFCGAWEIWKTRCRLKYDGELYNGTTILRRVYNLVHDITIMHKPKRQASTFDKICLGGENGFGGISHRIMSTS